MTEAELLEQMQLGRANIGSFISLVLTAHTAMIIGTHYFLGRERLIFKLMVFTIYTGGYVAILSLYQWELTQIDGLLLSLHSLAERGPVSAATDSMVGWTGGPGNLQAWLPWLLYLVSWAMVGLYLFCFGFFNRKTD